eukprot:TRINITY_DN2298_c1_g1_i1.p1 TRINITY_DN2298_c1_g1~~TRINITY_DN2298_c1_g1_i1.p1  ORF type:complete len:244 (-),score=38.59 TRINITY_DN2298_c1_g1_i1:1168-1899(-)
MGLTNNNNDDDSNVWEQEMLLRCRRSTSPPSRTLSPFGGSSVSGSGIEFCRKFLLRGSVKPVESPLSRDVLIHRFLCDSIGSSPVDCSLERTCIDISSTSLCCSSERTSSPSLASSVISGSGLYFIRNVLRKRRQEEIAVGSSGDDFSPEEVVPDDLLEDVVDRLVAESFDSEDSELIRLVGRESSSSLSSRSTTIYVPPRIYSSSSSLGFRPLSNNHLERVTHFQNVTRRAANAAKELFGPS